MRILIASLASILALAFPPAIAQVNSNSSAAGSAHQATVDLHVKSGPSAAIVFPAPDTTIDPAITPKVVIAGNVSSPRPLASLMIHACHSDDRSTCSANLPNSADLNVSIAGPYQVVWEPTLTALPTGQPTTFITWISARDIDGGAFTSPPVPFQVVIPDRNPLSIAMPSGELGLMTPASAFVLGSYVPKGSDAQTLDHVDLLDGSTTVGSLASTNATPPGYAFVWKDVSAGAHQMSLRAVDSAGKSLFSQPIPLYVVAPGNPIRVDLVEPRSGMTFSLNSPIRLRAEASVAGGTIDHVEFVDGTVVVATTTRPPFEATWLMPSIGIHAIAARAYDNLGNAAASRSAFVETPRRPRKPQVVLTTPHEGSITRLGNTVTFGAEVDAPDSSVSNVDFYADGELAGSIASAPFSLSWMPQYTGPHDVSAIVFDQAHFSSSSRTIKYVVTVDGNPPTGDAAPGTPPSVVLTSPADGARFKASDTIHLSANANGGEGAVKSVDYFADGVAVASGKGSGWRAEWTHVSAGHHAITAQATTYQSHSAISLPISIDVTSDSAAAITVTMAKPPADAMYYAGDALDLRPSEVHLTGSIARIEYSVDGVFIGASAQAPYTVEWDASTPGTHSIVATVYDTAGNAGTSSPVDLVVRPIRIQLAAPTQGAVAEDGTLFVEGTFEGPANVGILVNGVAATVDPRGHFFLNALSVPAGPSTLTATVSTVDGAKASTSVGVIGAEDDARVAQRVYASASEGLDSAEVDVSVGGASDVSRWRILDAKGATLAQGDSTAGVLATLHLPAPGLYRHTIEVTERSNRVVLKNVLTLVSSTADVEASRMAVVLRFLNALRREQRDRALDTLTAGLAVQFGGVYDALKGHWSDIIGSLGTPGAFSTDLDLFSAALTRERSGQRYLYLIEGMRDSDGVWRIDSF